MKNLSEVLEKVPAQQLTQPEPSPTGEAAIAPSQSSPLDIADRDIEEYLAHLVSQSQGRQNIRNPLDPQMMFRFACVGLAGGFLAVAGFIAWLYRPVNAMAQAQVTQDLGQAVIAMSHEVAAAKPSNTRCPIIGSCKVEAKPQQTAPADPIPVDLGAPIPVNTTMAPAPEEIDKARQFIHQWSVAGANSIAIRDHIFQIQNGQVHHPSFPHPTAFETAYANYYGVSQ